MTVLDGFWLPTALRDAVLVDAQWEVAWLAGGAQVPEGTPDALRVRWPVLSPAGWRSLFAGLQRGRSLRCEDAVPRWDAALERLGPGLLGGPGALSMLSRATGYSEPMLTVGLGSRTHFAAGSLVAALEARPGWQAARRWVPIGPVPGKVRFYPSRVHHRLRARVAPGSRLWSDAPATDVVLGFAAGNVPGTALLIALLGALANHGCGADTPALLIRNSRQEPLFGPWVLSAVEAVDPQLVAQLALLVWDYTDAGVRDTVMSRAQLLIAAAGDDAIGAIDAARRAMPAPPRFHRHGHKVSFAAIDPDRAPIRDVEALARLGALDSSLWDQNGCLSARVQFVAGHADAYADALATAMRSLAAAVPRGSTPRRFTHRAFDTYASLVRQGGVRLCSAYDDDFVVAVDRRPWDAGAMQRAVNLCVGRVVVVRPVRTVLEIPAALGDIPAANVQSLSVAVAAESLPALAEAAGARGVTAVRSLGRAAFPGLAYFWDGLLPADCAWLRPPGHFTTIDFDDPAEDLRAATR